MLSCDDFDVLHSKLDFNQFSPHLLNLLDRLDHQWQKKIILEVGCGQGGHSPFFYNKKSLGIDVSTIAIEKARLRYPNGNFKVSDVKSMCVPKERYDYILDSKLINCINLESLEIYLQFARQSTCCFIAEIAVHRHKSNILYEAGRYIYPYDLVSSLILTKFNILQTETIAGLEFYTTGLQESYPICLFVASDTKLHFF